MPRYRNYTETSMINMLNNLVEKLDNVHNQQIWTELEIIKRDQMDMLEIF